MCSERETQRVDARRRETESETQLREIHNLSNQLSNRNQPIQDYVSQNKAEALQRLTAGLDECKQRQDKLEAEVQVHVTCDWCQCSPHYILSQAMCSVATHCMTAQPAQACISHPHICRTALYMQYIMQYIGSFVCAHVGQSCPRVASHGPPMHRLSQKRF